MALYLSPAKLNLFLRILRRRSDGYHELASLFQAIAIFDKLQIELAEQDDLTCSDLSLPLDHRNLVIKAADLFRKKTGLKVGIKAYLEKHIPHEAGLGGGSGNAATTLWAMNELTNFGASNADLKKWAAEIGSDISFFFSQGTAYCTGRGEIMRDLPPLILHQKLWVVKPDFGLSTPSVYKALDVSALQPRDPESILEGFLKGRWVCFNDLEQPAFALKSELQDLKTRFQKAGYESVTMTGSGTAFFCFGDKAPDDLPYYTQTAFVNRKSDGWY